MNIYFIAFISGVIAVLTPAVFPYLIITPLIFEKLKNSNRQHKINILLYTIITSLVFVYILTQLISSRLLNEISFDSSYGILIHSSRILFLIWFLSSFTKKYQLLNFGTWMQFFRFLGLLIFSTQLALSAISSTGPILGTLMITNAENNDLISIIPILIAFSIGLILPFMTVLWIFTKKYDNLKLKKWWPNSQLITGGLLLLFSLVQLTLDIINF
ncbi:cytochrome c biogenesis protein CcdA [Aquimarina spinulae]|uniref:cytochrome c biogenesis protein CcdA n=1 Tax=Aquimarina spinulae TaxID=1192023 RepID=UPI000D551A43|nr:cytochrome c biogenesis protein CcdA [Aquimarina spinulae]